MWDLGWVNADPDSCSATRLKFTFCGEFLAVLFKELDCTSFVTFWKSFMDGFCFEFIAKATVVFVGHWMHKSSGYEYISEAQQSEQTG